MITLKQNRAIYALVRQCAGLTFSGEQLQWLVGEYDVDPGSFTHITQGKASEIIADLQRRVNNPVERTEACYKNVMGVPQERGGDDG